MSLQGLQESEKVAEKTLKAVQRSLRKQQSELADELAKTRYLLGDPKALSGWRTSLAEEQRMAALSSMMTDVEKLYLEAGDTEAARIFKARMLKELSQRKTNLQANALEVKLRAAKVRAETKKSILDGMNEVKTDSALRELYSQSKGAGGCFSGMFGRPFMKDLVTLETKAAGSKTLGQYMEKLYTTYEAGLKDVFVQGVIRGDSYKTMEQNLVRTTGVTAGKAKLLVRTESNAIMNDTVKQVIDNNPLVKGYRFRAVLDSRTSDICQKHDGEYIPKDKAVPGVNYPPLHPNCRSTVTTVLVTEDEQQDTMQRYTKNGSNTWIKVAPGMRYQEFRDTVMETVKYSRTLSDGRSVTREVYIAPNDSRIVQVGKDRMIPGVIASSATINGTLSSKTSDRAAALYARARQAEPAITEMMQQVVASKGSKLAGLEFSVKSAPSLENKVRIDTAEALKQSGLTPPQDYEVVEKMNDIVRYTVLSDHDRIIDNAEAVLAQMQDKGIEVIRLDNKYLKQEPSYRDVKIVGSKNGVRFEVQFHSEESLAIKEREHILYDKQKNLDPESEEYKELEREMADMWRGFRSPKGVERLVSFRK